MKRRLIFTVFGLVLGSILLLSLISGVIMRKSVRIRVSEHFAKLSEELYYNLERMHRNGLDLARLIAENPIVSDETSRPATVLAELLKVRRIAPLYEDISIVSTDGTVIAATDFVSRGDWGRKRHVREAFAGKEATSSVQVVLEPFRQIIEYAVPIRSGDRIFAVAVVAINLRQFTEVVAHLRVGRTGHAFVVDESGTIIIHPNVSHLFEHVEPSLTVGEKEGVFFTASGERYFANGYRPASVGSGLPNWGVIIAQSSDEFFAPFWRAIGMVTILLSIIVFLAWRVVIVLTRRILRPIESLAAATSRLARGESDVMVPVESDDELGRLAEAFNHMVASLRESKRTLESSERRYREMAELLPQIIFETDLQGRFTYVNKAGYALTHYEEKEVVGRLSFTEVVVPEDRERAKQKVQQIMQGNLSYGSEYRIVRKDGTAFPVYVYSAPRYENERVVGLRGIGLDLTEIRRTEEELRRKELQLIQAQKMESLGTLAGGIAHDFNNVLGGIGGVVSLLSYLLEHDREKLTFDLLRDRLDLVQQQVKRANDTIRQILAFSRNQEISFTSTDLVKVIRQVTNICEKTFGKSVRLEIGTLPERALVNGDMALIEQALLNLLVNAWHAMTIMRPEGEQHGGVATVTLTQIAVTPDYPEWPPDMPYGHYWCIRVNDTGVGIAPENISRIYDPFYTTKPIDVGTGLGLPMVYTIVKQHRGHIAVSSIPGVGTTFSLFLPVSREEESLDAGGIGVKSPWSGGTVLVADDDAAIREMVSEMFAILGYRTIAAQNGEEAIQIFKERQMVISFVVLDLLMPRLSGVEVLRMIRQTSPSLPALVMSGYHYDERLADAGLWDAVVVLQKPFTFEQFSEAVARLESAGRRGTG